MLRLPALVFGAFGKQLLLVMSAASSNASVAANGNDLLLDAVILIGIPQTFFVRSPVQVILKLIRLSQVSWFYNIPLNFREVPATAKSVYNPPR